jgi:hypothetical protein
LILKEITKISVRDFTNLLDPSGTRQARLVLVVSEVCAGRYRAGIVRDRSTRGQERFMGRSAAGAAVEMEKEVPLERADNSSAIRPFYDRMVAGKRKMFYWQSLWEYFRNFPSSSVLSGSPGGNFQGSDIYRVNFLFRDKPGS